MPPGISYQTSHICQNPAKPRGSNDFPFDHLMILTITLSPTKP